MNMIDSPSKSMKKGYASIHKEANIINKSLFDNNENNNSSSIELQRKLNFSDLEIQLEKGYVSIPPSSPPPPPPPPPHVTSLAPLTSHFNILKYTKGIYIFIYIYTYIYIQYS